MTYKPRPHRGAASTLYASFPRRRGPGAAPFAFGARHFGRAHDVLADRLRDAAERALGGQR